MYDRSRNEEITITGRSENSTDPSADSVLSASDPVVWRCPCKGGGEWELRRSKLQQWKTAFPEIDVELEARRAVQWLVDQPRQRRKTHKGMARFFFNWFSSVLDRRGRGLGYRPPRRVARDTERLFRDLESELETTK